MTNLTTSNEEDEEFFDALSSFPEHDQNNFLIKENNLNEKQRQRRVEIPPKLTNSSFSFLLTILKNSVGKDLTRISFPATFFRFNFFCSIKLKFFFISQTKTIFKRTYNVLATTHRVFRIQLSLG